MTVQLKWYFTPPPPQASRLTGTSMYVKMDLWKFRLNFTLSIYSLILTKQSNLVSVITSFYKGNDLSFEIMSVHCNENSERAQNCNLQSWLLKASIHIWWDLCCLVVMRGINLHRKHYVYICVKLLLKFSWIEQQKNSSVSVLHSRF